MLTWRAVHGDEGSAAEDGGVLHDHRRGGMAVVRHGAAVEAHVAQAVVLLLTLNLSVTRCALARYFLARRLHAVQRV